MKALVTGATGFIGSHLCEELARRGYEVTCLVREKSDLKWIENIDLKLITGDCNSIDSLFPAVTDNDYVFHLAGLTKACSKDDFFCANAEGTENLIRAVAEKNPVPNLFNPRASLKKLLGISFNVFCGLILTLSIHHQKLPVPRVEPEQSNETDIYLAVEGISAAGIVLL